MKLSLRELRLLKKLSPEQLAGMVGVSVQTIKFWENGSVDIASAKFKNIVSLSRALGVTINNMCELASQDYAETSSEASPAWGGHGDTSFSPDQ